MKLTVITLCILLVAAGASARSWSLFRRQSGTPASGRHPYYFGTTGLTCMVSNGRVSSRITHKVFSVIRDAWHWATHWLRRKKKAPRRSTISYSHRWIYYRGKYFEFGIRTSSGIDAVYGPEPSEKEHCPTHREHRAAGKSNLSVQCIEICAKNYKKHFGGYHLLRNNCHHFADKLSEVLYFDTRCPSWCR